MFVLSARNHWDLNFRHFTHRCVLYVRMAHTSLAYTEHIVTIGGGNSLRTIGNLETKVIVVSGNSC